MCEQLTHKICIAQQTADRTGVTQAVYANEIGGFNIIPAEHAEEGVPIITVGTRLDHEQLSDEQVRELFAMVGRGVSVHDTIRAIYALGHASAKTPMQQKIDALRQMLNNAAEVLNDD